MTNGKPNHCYTKFVNLFKLICVYFHYCAMPLKSRLHSYVCSIAKVYQTVTVLLEYIIQNITARGGCIYLIHIIMYAHML